MKLIEILKMIDKHYDYESDMPVKDYDIRSQNSFKIELCFMCEEETWLTIPINHPILRQYYYADVDSFYPAEEDILRVWINEKYWFSKINKE